MNKSELVKAIAEGSGLSQVDAKKALDATIAAIETTLAEAAKQPEKGRETVALVGFGTFSVQTRKEREGFNPSTGEKITIPAKQVVKFKAGAALEDKMN